MEVKERLKLVESLNTCNKCKHLNFAIKACCKDKKKRIYLSTFTTGDGFIHCLRHPECGEKNG